MMRFLLPFSLSCNLEANVNANEPAAGLTSKLPVSKKALLPFSFVAPNARLYSKYAAEGGEKSSSEKVHRGEIVKRSGRASPRYTPSSGCPPRRPGAAIKSLNEERKKCFWPPAEIGSRRPR